jgi:hypothetical protein
MTREYLIRYAIRKAVTIPPQKTPSHIWSPISNLVYSFRGP